MSVWARSTRVRVGTALSLLFAGISLVTLSAAPPAPSLNPPFVQGPQVTLSWSGSPGAVGYRLAIGAVPGGESFAQIVGPITSVSFDVPFVGTGYVRVQAFDATGLSAPSNEVVLTVTSMTPVPAPPVALQAFVIGRNVHLTWGPGAGGGAPLAVLLEAGSGPGQSNFGQLPLPLATSTTIPDVPAGVYFARVYAVNASGRSGPSNEVLVDVPVAGGCSAPPMSTLSVASTNGNVSFAWTGVPGVIGYRLDVAAGPAGPPIVAQPFSADTTSFAYPGAPAGTYYARIVSVSSCGSETTSPVVAFTVSTPPGGRRTPDPPPGRRLPLPNMSALVEQVGRQFPGDLRNSCREHGGNNVWLFRLITALRQHDTRWGLNWKRGVVNDMSQDAITYHFSGGPDEGSTDVYIIDVIGGHCGGNPQPSWIDQTEETRRQGTIGRWTLRPYVAAGGTP